MKLQCKTSENFSPNYTSTLIQKIKIPWLISEATAYNHHSVFSLRCSYPKDERAKPGQLLTKRRSFSPTAIKRLSLFSLFFTLSTFLLYFLPLSQSPQGLTAVAQDFLQEYQ
jgi:hypothetical protein